MNSTCPRFLLSLDRSRTCLPSWYCIGVSDTMQCRAIQQSDGEDFVTDGVVLLWVAMMLQDSKEQPVPHKQPTTDGGIQAGSHHGAALPKVPLVLQITDAHSRSKQSPAWSMLWHTICSTRNAIQRTLHTGPQTDPVTPC